MELEGKRHVSYLCARDPSILAYGHPLARGRNLYNEFLENATRTTYNDSVGCNSTNTKDTQAEEDKESTQLHVYLRMKTCSSYEHLYEISNDTLNCKVPDDAHCIRNVRYGTSVTKSFKFSKIFGPGTQQIDVFNDVVKRKLLYFINGLNCSLLTYGASGSGKTYTIVGTATEPGVVPRALEYLFRTLPQLPEEPRIKAEPFGGVIRLSSAARKFEKDASYHLLSSSAFNVDRALHIKTYKAMQQRLSDEPVAIIEDDLTDVALSVWVSFAEIYNEYIYDLLTPEPPRGKPRKKLRLGQCQGNAYIKDLTHLYVRSGLEAFQILQYGLHHLQYAATSINSHSSRSHCIFTIRLAQASDTKEGYSVSSINFCDLAGSERLKKSHNVGDRLKESNNINTSLLVLGRCINLVRESQKQNNSNIPIPFRESKLTQLFQKALQGQELISMIVNINPIREMFDETQHVLNFSALAKDVTIEQQQFIKHRPKTNRFTEYLDNKRAVDEEYDNDVVEELKLQITELTLELEQQKLEAKEDRDYVMNTYKQMLDEAHAYWEKRCQQLERMNRKKRIVIQGSSHQIKKQKKDTSVINLDSSFTSSEDESVTKEENSQKVAENKELEDKSAQNDFVAAQTKIMDLTQQIQEKNQTIKTLSAKTNNLQKTLEDAAKSYQQLETQYEKRLKEMQLEMIRKDEQINDLQSHSFSFPYLCNLPLGPIENKENTYAGNQKVESNLNK